MSNLYTRLQGAITTALGGITACNYLRKYLGKTHARLCHAMKEKQEETEREREKERDCMIYPNGGRGAQRRGYEQSQSLLQCTQQIYSHGKLSREGVLSP